MTFDIAHRFRSRARLATVCAFAAVAVLALVGGTVLGVRGSNDASLLAYLVVIVGFVLLLSIIAMLSARHAAALRYLAAHFPNGAVFLARRQPSVVSDMPAYLAAKGVTMPISDGWVPALVDGRGISAWTTGWRPREIVLMEWHELGEVQTIGTGPGIEKRAAVTVDVRPFVVPLTVEIGYSTGLITMALDPTACDDVVRAAQALRPENPVSLGPIATTER
jgi:hypothetical protein